MRVLLRPAEPYWSAPRHLGCAVWAAADWEDIGVLPAAASPGSPGSPVSVHLHRSARPEPGRRGGSHAGGPPTPSAGACNATIGLSRGKYPIVLCSWLTPRSAFETVFLDAVWASPGRGRPPGADDGRGGPARRGGEGGAARSGTVFRLPPAPHAAPPRAWTSSSRWAAAWRGWRKDYAFLFSVGLYHRISFLEPAGGPRTHHPARAGPLPGDGHRRQVEGSCRSRRAIPYYTQLVCHCMFDRWSRAPRSRRWTVADVERGPGRGHRTGLGQPDVTCGGTPRPGEQALMAGMAAAMHRDRKLVTIVDRAQKAWHLFVPGGSGSAQRPVAVSRVQRAMVAGSARHFPEQLLLAPCGAWSVARS